jgi:hypothetical protein
MHNLGLLRRVGRLPAARNVHGTPLHGGHRHLDREERRRESGSAAHLRGEERVDEVADMGVQGVEQRHEGPRMTGPLVWTDGVVR